MKSYFYSRIFLAGCLLVLGSRARTQGPMITSNSSNSNTLVTRNPDSRGWSDPALNHNKLLQQQTGDGVFKLIGPYKVIGSPYLFGEHHKADIYAPEAKAFNIYISYNTYNQELEFYSTSNPAIPLVKEPGTVDSFLVHANRELGMEQALKFIYGSALGSKEKFYYQEICKGDPYSLYKRYLSDLGYSSTNIVQSELRQFDLQFEYYYLETGGKSLKKIKANSVNVTREFKAVTDLSTVITPQDFEGNPEPGFCKAFRALNQAKKNQVK